MNDLISRQKVLNVVHDFFKTKIDKVYGYRKEVPTVDAVPVVHGRWVDNGIPHTIFSGCSVCEFPCGALAFNYCPNCGAKMDGGVEDE